LRPDLVLEIRNATAAAFEVARIPSIKLIRDRR